MRVLHVMFDGGGNVGIQLPIIEALVERGHDVRVLGHRCQRDRVEATGAAFTSFAHAPDADASRPETDLLRDWEARTPIGAFARLRDNLMCGPALEFARDVIAEVERDRPDVIAFDYLVVGAGIAAEATGTPCVELIHTVYPLPRAGVPPFGQGFMPATGSPGRARDAVLTWGFRRAFAPGLRPVNAARRELGLDPVDEIFDQFLRPDRALVLTSQEFDFKSPDELPRSVRYSGPVLPPRGASEWTSPWPADDARPLVLASFSTTFQDQRDLGGATLAALGELPVRGLVTTGPALDLEGFPVPPNVEVREFVPHRVVLPDADLVVTHAGLGTVHAALAAGVPMVCIPDGRDQNDNAARVVAAGAGVRIGRRASATKLRDAIGGALEDASLAAGAARLADVIAHEDGLETAVGEVESVASGAEDSPVQPGERS